MTSSIKVGVLVLAFSSACIAQVVNPSSAGVTSVTGTANQVTVTGTTSPVISLPTNVVIAGSMTAASYVSTAAGGTGSSWQCAEGTDPGTEASLLDLFWCSSSTHRAMLSNNNGTSGQIALSTDTLAFFGAGLLATNTTAATGAANAGGTNVATQAYADRVIAKPLFTGNSSVNSVFVSGSDFTSSSSSATAITGLSWTLPANTAASYKFDCIIVGSEATSATAITYSVNSVTVAPTAGTVVGYGATTATTSISTTIGATYTATGSKTILIITPGSAVSGFWAHLEGSFEYPSNGSTSVFQVEVAVGGNTNVLSIKRGSSCRLSQ